MWVDITGSHDWPDSLKYSSIRITTTHTISIYGTCDPYTGKSVAIYGTSVWTAIVNDVTTSSNMLPSAAGTAVITAQELGGLVVSKRLTFG